MKSIAGLLTTAVYAQSTTLPDVDANDFTLSKYNNLIDHFNYQATETYQQRYWVNDVYWTDESSPFFLYLCGEWVCDVPASYPFMLGASYGAKLIVLEHRFYGESQPFTDWSEPNLRYLSSE